MSNPISRSARTSATPIIPVQEDFSASARRSAATPALMAKAWRANVGDVEGLSWLRRHQNSTPRKMLTRTHSYFRFSRSFPLARSVLINERNSDGWFK